MDPYSPNQLPEGVRSRFVDNGNGLRMHLLEAGHEKSHRPAVMLLHGFPELAYCWRKVMPILANAGYHVIAPDQRGYGRTTGGATDYDCDLTRYHPVNLARDIAGLVKAMGLNPLTVIGHDFGSPVAGYCATLYPEIFTAAVFMSAPFEGIASPHAVTTGQSERLQITRNLARLNPPKKHYQDYYCSAAANRNMTAPPAGLKHFQRAYYHIKSADWSGNSPRPLADGSATTLATMPPYYIMPAELGMAESVSPHAPKPAPIAADHWLSDSELEVFHSEFSRTGFQGGLNWYRAIRLPAPFHLSDKSSVIPQPTCFISGAQDWGTYQKPGALTHMQTKVCPHLKGVHLIANAGHWVQQEQADKTATLFLSFLQEQSTCPHWRN